MSDTTSNDKTIRAGGRKPLSLKRDTDTVRQSFSGGRSKAVVVEKKRSRVPLPGKRPDLAAPVAEPAPKPVEPARPQVQTGRAEPVQQPQQAQPRPRCHRHGAPHADRRGA
jgi:translation initiation factor IF-2